MFGFKKKIIDKITEETKLCFNCDLHFNPIDGFIFKYCPMCGKKLYGFDEESFKRLEKEEIGKLKLSIDELCFYNRLEFEDKVKLISLFRYNFMFIKKIDSYNSINEDITYSIEFYKELDLDEVEFLKKLGFNYKEIKTDWSCE